jgi:hypothetical protein
LALETRARPRQWLLMVTTTAPSASTELVRYQVLTHTEKPSMRKILVGFRSHSRFEVRNLNELCPAANASRRDGSQLKMVEARGLDDGGQHDRQDESFAVEGASLMETRAHTTVRTMCANKSGLLRSSTLALAENAIAADRRECERVASRSGLVHEAAVMAIAAAGDRLGRDLPALLRRLPEPSDAQAVVSVTMMEASREGE